MNDHSKEGSWAVKPTFNQSVFVSWGGTSKNTKFGPNFVQSLLFNLKVTEAAETIDKVLLLLDLKPAKYQKPMDKYFNESEWTSVTTTL